MTTEQKLSQMMIVGLRSDAVNTKCATEINADYAELLKKYDFGGIILFTGNMTDVPQTVKLIRDSQDAAMSSVTVPGTVTECRTEGDSELLFRN